jgi:hypothetical protein
MGISSKTMLQHRPADEPMAVMYEVSEDKIISKRLWPLRTLDLKDMLLALVEPEG